MKFTVKMFVLMVLLFGGGNIGHAKLQPTKADDGSNVVSYGNETLEFPESPLILDVTLKRIYLDGEESEEVLKEKIWALEDFWAKYQSWQLIDMNDDRLVFQMDVDDISPLLKVNGFFGLSDDGTLSIYNGKPEKDEVIHSFFQIDIKKLEGKKHLQLKQGIPIKSKEEYAKVLEAMKQYSIGLEN